MVETHFNSEINKLNQTKMNQEIKERIFALYWGQNIIANDKYGWRQNETFDTALSACNGDLSKWYIKVKHLSSITDEDAIEAAKMNKSFKWDETINVYESWKGTRVVEGSKDCGFCDKMIIREESLLPCQVDYLRSRGYALPYMNYSVDELVKEGVFKLIEP